MAQPSAKLRNVTDELFEDYVNGDYYFCEPGETISVPVGVAKHWIGDWGTPDIDDAREKEAKRVRQRIPADEPVRMELVTIKEPPVAPAKRKKKGKSTGTILDQQVEAEFPKLDELKKADEAAAPKPRKKTKVEMMGE